MQQGRYRGSSLNVVLEFLARLNGRVQTALVAHHACPASGRAVDGGQPGCRCGCGEERMSRDFMMRLVRIREELGFPIGIQSGYRCPEHNNRVSPTGYDGPHTTGKAADLALSYSRARDALSILAQRFPGIGIKQHGDGRFIHVDMGPRRIWTYS